jgi:hypothetical protein
VFELLEDFGTAGLFAGEFSEAVGGVAKDRA